MDAINAKIRSMKARLLKIEQYRSLVESNSAQPHSTRQIEPMTEELKRVSRFLADVHLRKLLALVGAKDLLGCWSLIKTMPRGQNRHVCTFIKGTEIDLYNIQCINRLKHYYPEADIYPHLVPVCYRLTKDAIKQIIETKAAASAAGDFTYDNNIQIMKKTYRTAIKNYPRSIGGILEYFYLKELEEQNLVTIMEGIKYKLPPEEIIGHLKL